MAGIVTLPGGPYLANGRPNTKRSDPKSVSELVEPLQTRVRAMIADCPHRGELGLTSGLRDPGRQWDLRAARVGIAKVWTYPPRGVPTTAVPARWNGSAWVGGSKHQHGLAADFGGTKRAMDWMRANRERYGLALTVPSEGWHVEANARDVLTGRVHNSPTALKGGSAPAPPTTAEDYLDMAQITETQLRKIIREEVDDGANKVIGQVWTGTAEILTMLRSARGWLAAIATKVYGSYAEARKVAMKLDLNRKAK